MISMFFVMLCRETVLQYSIEAMKLQRRLLGLISESLGLEPNSLEDGLGELIKALWWTIILHARNRILHLACK